MFFKETFCDQIETRSVKIRKIFSFFYFQVRSVKHVEFDIEAAIVLFKWISFLHCQLQAKNREMIETAASKTKIISIPKSECRVIIPLSSLICFRAAELSS